MPSGLAGGLADRQLWKAHLCLCPRRLLQGATRPAACSGLLQHDLSLPVYHPSIDSAGSSRLQTRKRMWMFGRGRGSSIYLPWTPGCSRSEAFPGCGEPGPMVGGPTLTQEERAAGVTIAVCIGVPKSGPTTRQELRPAAAGAGRRHPVQAGRPRPCSFASIQDEGERAGI
ncbi:uncharacterized protein LOC124982575 isoform X1 [Sciurus carolinensis]|uniref:uncharacterized protein LOC124982575 isoform X1 n=1 Tax=Sciurus carolinensis TaxID=30640 RepID=UPI001FB4A915|nr:uncharacterized protein LOC124982575 isoform X1 [Sciurus carolinensis]XP_047405396.1 uncharacterized protein LOC124982575 isoform X1 [Sciurus carolinensis]XP_047405397.1 uncharacterized protein LOC124982575 isoform X1 [Sciurus carolinensis]XP_047405398.1 uncharacterized protein LOC124982575 isoform X1 [Sciurus carolinensis]